MTAQLPKYLMLNRTLDTKELLRDPHAFVLLTLVALRARRTNGIDTDSLTIGQALIGDYETIGLTRQEYRTALKHLEKYQILTTQPTNKGTVATLCNSTIYDINSEEDNQLDNQRPTTKQPTPNHRVTTNKNGKNVIREEEIYKFYPRKAGKGKAIPAITKALTLVDCEHLTNKVKEFAVAVAGADKQFIPHPATWFNQQRWTDEPGEWATMGRNTTHQPAEEEPEVLTRMGDPSMSAQSVLSPRATHKGTQL